MASARDQEVLLFNALTGNLDLALKFNADRIITHSLNPIGHQLASYDPAASTYFSMDFVVVTDNAGNVVST